MRGTRPPSPSRRSCPSASACTRRTRSTCCTPRSPGSRGRSGTARRHGAERWCHTPSSASGSRYCCCTALPCMSPPRRRLRCSKSRWRNWWPRLRRHGTPSRRRRCSPRRHRRQRCCSSDSRCSSCRRRTHTWRWPECRRGSQGARRTRCCRWPSRGRRSPTAGMRPARPWGTRAALDCSSRSRSGSRRTAKRWGCTRGSPPSSPSC